MLNLIRSNLKLNEDIFFNRESTEKGVWFCVYVYRRSTSIKIYLYGCEFEIPLLTGLLNKPLIKITRYNYLTLWNIRLGLHFGFKNSLCL